MKFQKKKLALNMTLCSALVLSLLTGCGSTGSGSTASGTAEYTIGVTQIAEHGSLDNCRKGFIEGLAEAGFKENENIVIDYQNAQGDPSTATMIAQNFVSKNYDLVCAISTTSAMACYNAAQGTDIPTVFTAVSDPVYAQLVQSLETPGRNCTGTCDALPVEDQLKMIREMMPDAKKIGILYTTSEENSAANLAIYKELASKYDFEIVDYGITSSSDIPLAMDSLLGKVDCISNMTDNNVVNNLDTVLSKASEANIPVFGSEVEQVVNGCVASMGLDYVAIGRQTGKMAAEILSGSNPAEMPVITVNESSLYINSDIMAKYNLTVPDSYKDSYTDVK